MKKSYILILVGVFIIITSMLCINGRDNFKKSKYFNSTEELINSIDNKPLKILTNYSFENSINLKEALSKRKRVYGSGIDFTHINFEEVIKISEEDTHRILAEYERRCKKLKDYKIPTKKIPLILKGYAYNNIYSSNDDEENIPKPINAELVAIDEGEGYVIDYLIYSFSEKNNEEYYGGDR